MHISKKGNCIKIKVIAIGIGDAMNNPMIRKLPDVEIIFVDSDTHATEYAYAERKLQTDITIACASGSGIKIEPDAGRQRIRKLLQDADIVFVVADMEADAGSNPVPVIAETVKRLGIFTIAVLDPPQIFEKRQTLSAGTGIADLDKTCDAVIVISGREFGAESTGMKSNRENALRETDDGFFLAIRAINELLNSNFTCFDLDDVRSILCGGDKVARMTYGTASGKNRALEAAKRAVSKEVDIHAAQGALILISGNEDMLLDEYDQAVSHICDMADGDANIMCGMICDDDMGEELGVTVIVRSMANSH